MSKVQIAYDNKLKTASSITCSQEDTDNPLENMFDDNLWDFFKSDGSATVTIDVSFTSAVSLDTFCFFKTNLASVGASIELLYDNGGGYTSAVSVTPTDTKPVMKQFTEVSSDTWRISITGATDVVSIGDLSISKAISPQLGVWSGFSPPHVGRDVKFTTNVSEGGLNLGRSKRVVGWKGSLNIEFESVATMRSTILPFLVSAEDAPFYFAWNFTDYPTEVIHAWTDGSAAKPKHTHAGLMSVNLRMEGLIE